ncbi:MAG: hypothetical protein IJX62_02450 [Clostridia bacterium]|nr:hypothetical protein [Clostridia bacterium]
MIFKQERFAENLTKADGIFSAEVPCNLQFDYAKAKNWTDYQYADHYKLFAAPNLPAVRRLNEAADE